MGPPSKPPATENFSRRSPILSRFGCMDARQMEGLRRENLFLRVLLFVYRLIGKFPFKGISRILSEAVQILSFCRYFA